ncbi:MAG: hypothetical protein INR70_11335 [Parafilimonas terrae]|nr:hypothetical protein [Parafilimonas terrae]
MVDVSPTAELLDRIAAALGVPVETFTARPTPAASSNAVVDQVAALLVDPDGWRLAIAFDALPPQFRRSLADIAEAILASSTRSEAA